MQAARLTLLDSDSDSPCEVLGTSSEDDLQNALRKQVRQLRVPSPPSPEVYKGGSGILTEEEYFAKQLARVERLKALHVAQYDRLRAQLREKLEEHVASGDKTDPAEVLQRITLQATPAFLAEVKHMLSTVTAEGNTSVQGKQEKKSEEKRENVVKPTDSAVGRGPAATADGKKGGTTAAPADLDRALASLVHLERLVRRDAALDPRRPPDGTKTSVLAVLQGNKLHAPVTSSRVIVGRGSSSSMPDIDLRHESPCPTISRHQVTIRLLRSHTFVLRNVGQARTWVNGRQVMRNDRARLPHNALVQIGQQRFVFLVRRPSSPPRSDRQRAS